MRIHGAQNWSVLVIAALNNSALLIEPSSLCVKESIVGLEHHGLEEDWRANILHVEQLTCVIKKAQVPVNFVGHPLVEKMTSVDDTQSLVRLLLAYVGRQFH